MTMEDLANEILAPAETEDAAKQSVEIDQTAIANAFQRGAEQRVEFERKDTPTHTRSRIRYN